MAKQRMPAPLQSLQSIDRATLEGVSGGRMLERKGPDPSMISGIGQLAEMVKMAGAARQQKEQEKAGQMQQMMQMMMQKRQGG